MRKFLLWAVAIIVGASVTGCAKVALDDHIIDLAGDAAGYAFDKAESANARAEALEARVDDLEARIDELESR